MISEKKPLKIRKRIGYQLLVKLTNFVDINYIKAFKDKLTNQIWTDLEQRQYIDKKYLFNCHNYFGKYHLINWQELNHHG